MITIWSIYKKYRKRSQQIYYSNVKPSIKKTHNIWTGLPKEKILHYQDSIEKSQYLVKLMAKTKFVKKQSIFEIGTNIGRNLNYLHQRNCINLFGIEINPNAVEMMKKTYSTLKADIITGSLEDELYKISSNRFAMTFSLAVLMHINPKSNFIFKEIARITSKYLIIIEREEQYYPPSIFPRNYYMIFTNLGFKQIFSELVPIKSLPNNYTARVFEKK